ncbi:MAG TPA: cob(I)yrinic acid a,c-diamide adenosyltransferase [Opitutaceae bacterium]|nr:cob(I)yrinic acid a,c-diamide adenosyltransferase [Opitutaceae bacterium]
MAGTRKTPARSIATRTGDDGTTGLLYGQRVPKDHPQIEAVGAFDELNTALGLAKATCPSAIRRTELEKIQKDLVALMGELACPEKDAAKYAASKFSKLGAAELAWVDAAVAALEAKKISFAGWATPGANLHAAAIDLARTVARRAERRLTALPAHGRTVRPVVRQWVNRVADLLWLMARDAEQ